MNPNWKIQPSIEVCAVQCGAKCCTAPGYFPISNAEYKRLKELNPAIKVQRRDRDTWILDHGFNGGRCPFLADDNLCTIHDERPNACRRFPSRSFTDCLVWPA